MNQDFKTPANAQVSSAVQSDFNHNKIIVKTYSWTIIVLLLVFFFPIGFYLLYKRFTADKTDFQKNSKGLRNTGVILVGIGLLYALMGITGQLDTTDGSSVVSGIVIMLLVFGGTGGFFLISSIKVKILGKKYNKYVNIVLNSNCRFIDDIASNAGVSYEVAKNDLIKMIDLGFLPGAYINESSREIILPQMALSQNQQSKVIICKGCGASNTVFIGETCVCKYCGSPIE